MTAKEPGRPRRHGRHRSALPLAYTLKFSVKNGPLAIDYPVMPLEGLWWADDMASFTEGNNNKWKWTYMIMQPELITAEMVRQTVVEVRRKKNPAALDKVKFEKFNEGKAASVMYKGPYEGIGKAYNTLLRWIEANGYHGNRSQPRNLL